MKLPYEYSEKEIKLIKVLNMLHIAKDPNQPPVLLYNWLAIECFRKNINNSISDSVRNCLLALENNNGPKRLTQEFDALITI